jgi:hypothetical protein
MVNQYIVTPSEFNTEKLSLGYFNANGVFYELKSKDELKQTIRENHYKVHIGYLHNDEVKHFLFTYDVDINWKELPKGVINYNNFFNKDSKAPKLDLLMDTKKTYIDDFIDMLNSIKIECKKIMEVYIQKKKK